MEKLLLGMIGGFLGLTILIGISIFALSSDFPFFVHQKITKFAQNAPIQISGPLATPTPVLFEEKPITATTPAKIVQPRSGGPTIQADTVYSLINAYRKEHNLSPLRPFAALELSAFHKLESMRANNYWRHEGPDGTMDWSVFEQAGYNYAKAGENLSFGNNTPWEVFNAWVNSPQHNAQLLNPEYEDFGMASDCVNYQEAGQHKCAVVLHLGKQQ